MNDFRGELCLIEEKYMAKCIEQDFIGDVLIFETTEGLKFEYKGTSGVEKLESIGLTFEDVKRLLPKLRD